MFQFFVYDSWFWWILALVVQLLGLFAALHAIWHTRTPQATTAWVVGLLALPVVTIPLYLLLGRDKFVGYADERREFDKKANEEVREIQNFFKLQSCPKNKKLQELHELVSSTNQPGFLGKNRFDLLIDGDSCYAKLKADIEGAEKYILFQFFTIKVDEVGRAFQKLLIKKAGEGLRIYFLYDAIGSSLDKSFIGKLTAAGVLCSPFTSSKSSKPRLQINFRNHRKLVVVDGKVAFVGGLNLGREYLGKDPKIGKWRDTHLKIEGPSALAGQFSFFKDWYWTAGEAIDLNWCPHPVEQGSDCLTLHTGPSDELELCTLALTSLIDCATNKIRISNPYLIPTEPLYNSLIRAHLRGVDLHIIIPKVSDNKYVKWASQVHVARLLKAGIKISAYKDGFIHQKVIQIDDEIVSIGSTNLDPRSISINFEIMAVTDDLKLNEEVKTMLENDLDSAQPLELKTWTNRSFWAQMRSKAVNLFSPIL